MATKSTVSLWVRMRTEHVHFFFPFSTLVAPLHISWPLFTFCTSNLAPFPIWSTTSSNLLTGTRKFQCIVLPPLLTATGANKTTPLQVGTSYNNYIGFYSKRNVSTTHQIAWAGSLIYCVGGEGLCPLPTPINRWTPPILYI